MEKIKLLIIIFIVWRLFLFIPLLVGNTVLPFNQINKDAQIWAYTRPYPPVSNIVLFPWANFDGVHYLTIAGDGYNRGAEGRFFPLYPILIKGISQLLGGTTIYGTTQFVTALFLSNVACLGSILLLFMLLRMDYSEDISFWSCIFMLVIPTSFFFVSIYTESLFLLLTLLSLYSLRKKNFLIACIAGSLLGLTRIVGVAIFFPILYEFFITHRKILWKKKIIAKALPLLLLPIGIFGFMYMSYLRFNDWIFFIHAQGAVNERSRIILFIPQTIFRYAKILTSLSPHQFEWWISLLEISSFFFAIGLLLAAWKKGIRHSYLLFAGLCFLMSTISGSFSGLPRYVAILFPIYIPLAYIKQTPIKIVLCLIGLILLFILTMFFSRGYFIS